VVQLETGLAWIGLSEDNLAEVYALGASYPNRVPDKRLPGYRTHWL